MNIVIVKINRDKIDVYFRKNKELAEELAIANEQLFKDANVKITEDFKELEEFIK